MKRITVVAIAATLVAALPSQAQNLEFGGLAFNHEIMSVGDLQTLSRPQNFGTARFMAMGGAFTSLGADVSSMSLNPAGLGMYRRNEISLTPMVSVSKASTKGVGPWAENGKNRFSMANIGAALNVYTSSSTALVSATFGFGMNRVADFNTRYSYFSESRFDEANNRQAASIADIFSMQLQQGSGGNSIFPEPGKDGNPNGPLDLGHPYFWPAVLGYKMSMIGVGEDEQGKYWGRYDIGHNASMGRSVDVVNAGSINEFDLSFGLNFNNFLYIGATLGIQSVYKTAETVYGENYNYYNNQGGLATDPSGAPLVEQLNYADLWQRTKISGSGVNFKLGAIVRPTQGLRLGVAFHTPTYYSLDQSYQAGMQALLQFNQATDSSKKFEDLWWESDLTENDPRDNWTFFSPSRLMFGASYTFGQWAIVSVDYERNWYNGIRSKNVPYNSGVSTEYFKSEFKNNFCATNSLRAGIELKPLPILALRVGGGYTSSMLKDESLYYEMPLTTESYFFSAGAGVQLSKTVSLDLAYQHVTDKQNEYALFYAREQFGGPTVMSSGLFETKFVRHFMSMTLGFRF